VALARLAKKWWPPSGHSALARPTARDRRCDISAHRGRHRWAL